MARRTATVYKHLEIEVTYQQLQEFLDFFKKSDFKTEVRVFNNGDSELVLFDSNQEIPFSASGGGYKIIGSYSITDSKLAHLIQSMIRKFKGQALVHRIYEHYTIEYHYYLGSVTLIKEFNGSKEKIIYYAHNQELIRHLTQLFSSQVVEKQISLIKDEIDMLLDQRCEASHHKRQTIDIRLSQLSNQLFILEA
jgi:hypothetical protein